VLEKIERQTFRAAKIVNGLLNLARPARSTAVPCDINAVVNDVLSLLEHQFRTAASRSARSSRRLRRSVQGIEHKLQQVFLNLFLNARDAMPKGGWLTIVDARRARRRVVEIADTGSGIPAEQLSRIYDPFFTTKEIGKGTGLGLSITYGIVQEHGGIDHMRQSGRAGHAVLDPPAARGGRENRADVIGRTAQPARCHAHSSILVIDDEEIMREILETLLTREGYQVRLASTAAEGSSWRGRCRSTPRSST
jgi:nitrogen-specific signal transduction histidine kinase